MRILTCLFLAVLTVSAQAANPSVPELLASHAQAIGVLDKMQSRRVRLRDIGMAPFEIPVTIDAKRPNLIRKEVALQGAVQVSAYDGGDAWKTDPFVPNGQAPAALPAEEAKALLEEADFDGALINAQAKGNRVSYIGKADVAGKAAHGLRLTLANGNEAVVYLDAASFLEVKRVQTRPMKGKPVELEIWSSNYRVVDGVRIPHRIEIGAPGATERVAIVIDAVSFNVALAANHFTRPR